MRRPVRWLGTHGRRLRRWGAGLLIAFLLLLLAAATLLDEPLRRLVENQMNGHLRGYTASVRALDFHPIGFALDLYDVVLSQDANPDPPVMKIDRLSANVQWSALIFGRLVADFELVKPVVYVNRQHLEGEARDDVPVEEHGWQDALQSIYPLKINEFRVRDGAFTYVEAGQARPLSITAIDALAEDIRNVRSKAGDYPSPLHLEATVFERGRLAVTGHADFLAAPHAGVKGNIEVADIALDYFRPVLARYDIIVSRGVVSGRGAVEYAPTVKQLDLETLRVDGLQAEYLYRKRTAAVNKEVAKKTAEAAQEVSNAPDVVLRAREVRVKGAEVAFVNKEATPEYRVFIDQTDLALDKFSNQKSEGTGQARLTGRFMGSGRTVVAANFRPETTGPDFGVDVKIENTELRTMNQLLRAHAKMDVTSGLFSVYSELAVRKGRIDGYVKPLFRDLKVYDPAQDADKSMGQKIKEKASDLVGKVFKNRPREEVATRAEITGPVDNPKASTWEVVVNLVQNAFFRAILPGFERDARRPGRD